jgi:amino acid permease
MNLSTLTTSIGLAAAGFLAISMGGAHGTGVLAGYLSGAAITGFCLVRQRRVLRTAPQRALQTMVEGFLGKLGGVVVGTLAILFVPGLRNVLDLASFLLAFAAAVLLVLLPGTFENARILRERRAE